VLDLRAGTLTRNADWESPTGGRVRVRSRRLVSLTQRAVAAIEYVVEAVDQTLRLIVQSELVAKEPTPPRSGDPRRRPCLRTRSVSSRPRGWKMRCSSWSASRWPVTRSTCRPARM
jgi:glycosyl hydrolase family 65